MNTESSPAMNYLRIILWMVLAVLFYFAIEFAFGLLETLVNMVPVPQLLKAIVFAGVKVMHLAVLAVVPFLILAHAKKNDLSGNEGLPFPKTAFIGLLIAVPALKILDSVVSKVGMMLFGIHDYYGYMDYGDGFGLGYGYSGMFSVFPWLKVIAMVVVGIVLLSKLDTETRKNLPKPPSRY